jgi:hypothetical protein
VIVVGVGNTSGVGNSAKDAEAVKEWVEKHEKDLKARQKKNKKKGDDIEDIS